MDEYLNLARQGKNDLWRYLLGVLIILFSWQILGSLPMILLVLWVKLDGNPTTQVTSTGVEGINIIANFIGFMLASWFFLAGILVVVHFLHKRSLLILVTPAHYFAWRRVLQSFGIWFGLAAMLSLVEALLHPGRYSLSFNMSSYLPFFFLALVLIPIQTTAEELFFRGYLLQGIGLHLRNIWILSILSGLIFGAGHMLNPEASSSYLLMGVYYFFMGFIPAFLVLRDGSLEIALGMHAANNLFTSLIANYTLSVLPSPALFTVNELDVVYTVISALLALAFFVWIFMVPLRRKVIVTD